jgi:hypothetical protein
VNVRHIVQHRAAINEAPDLCSGLLNGTHPTMREGDIFRSIRVYPRAPPPGGRRLPIMALRVELANSVILTLSKDQFRRGVERQNRTDPSTSSG